MTIILPHVFQDGVSEAASGVQVDENLNVLKAAIEAVEAAVALTNTQKSAMAIGAGLHPPTNSHVLIPGTELVTPALTTGQVLMVYGLVFAEPSGNTVQAALTINGAENAVNEPESSIVAALPMLYRISGVTGVQTLAVNGWATSSAGVVNALLAYQLLNG